MYASNAFQGVNPASRFHIAGAGGPASQDMAGGLSLIHSPSEDEQNAGKLLHPDNPLVWFAGIAALAFGLMAASTTIRVGPVKAGLEVGNT